MRLEWAHFFKDFGSEQSTSFEVLSQRQWIIWETHKIRVDSSISNLLVGTVEEHENVETLAFNKTPAQIGGRWLWES